MRRETSRGVALALVALGAAGASPVAAHLGHVVLRAERYLKVDVAREEARVVVSLALGPDEAVRVLRAADADADGAVTRDEASRYLAQWGDGLRTDLPIEVDGAPIAATWTDGWLDPVGRIERVPLNVEMVAHVPLEPGRHRVTIHDRMRVETFERTDVAFEVRDGVALVASGDGEHPTEPTPALTYGPRAPARSLTAVVEIEGTTKDERAALLLGAGALVVVSLAAWLLVRRSRR